MGRLTGHEKSSNLDIDYGGNEMMYSVKTYGELLKEASSVKKRGAELSGVDYFNEDMIPFNVSNSILCIAYLSN